MSERVPLQRRCRGPYPALDIPSQALAVSFEQGQPQNPRGRHGSERQVIPCYGWAMSWAGWIWRLSLFAVLLASTQSFAKDEKAMQKRYCAGMDKEYRVTSGGRGDCLSAEYAIEVDYADMWAQAVGQSLYYAQQTGRKPGIILLCESSATEVEGLCRSYVYRLSYALQLVRANVKVWYCLPEDATLENCALPDVRSKLPTPRQPATSFAAPGFSCSGKATCKQMATCEEARFYLKYCGARQLDGNGDGIPCNALCRR